MNGYSVPEDIPRQNEWTNIELIDKGWSQDKKFSLIDKPGRKLLLRISSVDEYIRKKAEYEMMTKLSELGILMPMPVDFGVCGNGEKVYSLLTWVEGEDAADVLPRLSEEQQYQLGVSAGQMLAKMHSIKVTKLIEPWAEKYKRKIQRVADKYSTCGVELLNADKILQFIKNNTRFLEGRPETFQHGDFHVGNLIIAPDRRLWVIDFNRSSFGDPWEEYDRYVFTWKVSIPFAIGQIHGYFNNYVPDEFFRLMALYNATNIIASIPWAINYGSTELDQMIENAEDIFKCYDGFETHIPVWYKEPGCRFE